MPPLVTEVATAYDTQQQAIVERAVTLLGFALERGSSPEAWRDAIAGIGEELIALQVLSASLADDYLTAVLEAQGADPAALAAVNADAWADTTDGGGSWLRYLVFAPASVQQNALTSGLSLEAAVAQMQTIATSVLITGLRDTARSSVQAGMQARPAVTTYVRMLRHPSCARCVILAGKRSNRREAFKRHHHCDCVNVPAAEDSGNWTTRPKDYFRSLPREEQDRIFTKAGAEAIRMGADMNQVVNARQGITTVTAYGREVQATTTGITIRGLAGQRLASEGLAKTGRYRAATTPRLLPDEIFQLAEQGGWDRAEMLRQLRRFGYVL